MKTKKYGIFNQILDQAYWLHVYAFILYFMPFLDQVFTF